jgi:fermentation-respiration switch protein FrsA (DUF1100 family)
MLRPLLHALVFLPSRPVTWTPAEVDLPFADVDIVTEDGERLHGWWIPARTRVAGHVLLCHGNAGNVGDRVPHAALLSATGFDVLLFDYRGYGRSSGRPSEDGTYRDARAARAALLAQPGVEPGRVLYLGESLGGAVALALALQAPPAGLVLQSTFTSIRDMARRHYPFIPPSLVPDAYPSLSRIGRLRAPVLVIHGERDTIVPPMHGDELFAAAPEPKRLHRVHDADHNDLVTRAGGEWAGAIASWAASVISPR